MTGCARGLYAALLVATAAAAADTPRPGTPWTLALGSGSTLQMAWIPAGQFSLGSPPSEALRGVDESPLTRVTLSHGFWLGRTLVTIGEWKKVMGWGVREQLQRALQDNRLHDFNGRRQTLRAYMHFSAEADPGEYLSNETDQLPMYFVSWLDALAFCTALTARERAAGRLPPHFTYGLPTEAQWEYARRAGSATAGDPPLDEIAWYEANSADHYTGKGWRIQGRNAGPHPVALKRANAWGLYDMAGNLWEWCRDWYGPYPGGAMTDPTGPRHGVLRVNRGGSFGSSARDQRAATRAGNPPAEASAFRGFRLALVSD